MSRISLIGKQSLGMSLEEEENGNRYALGIGIA